MANRLEPKNFPFGQKQGMEKEHKPGCKNLIPLGLHGTKWIGMQQVREKTLTMGSVRKEQNFPEHSTYDFFWQTGNEASTFLGKPVS
ncbi:hypothetical protein FRX31_022783 [Thalictrum thalictroides]|uniref:Uncharacterized protein n=1 Tax=Thalictrum thalictroides TaxID=46969 RepID=A0A7J6VRX6_THATH|nr:hypothetical protein FRX31_022783 [Thalictrum thalictroides]